jgi:hypothetical protein
VIVIALFFSPLVLPSDSVDLTTVVACVFVILCHVFKVQSFLKIIVPVVLFVFVMPIVILTAIARPLSSSWGGAVALFCSHCTSSVFLALTLPALLAVLLHFALLKVFSLRRQKNERLKET